jgi:hypothetical protein
MTDLDGGLEWQPPQQEPTARGDRTLGAWSDRRVATHGRAICHQDTLPTHPEVANQQAAVLEEWARRWRQRGPRDTFGEVELGLIGEVAAELRRIAAGVGRQLGTQREADRER